MINKLDTLDYWEIMKSILIVSVIAACLLGACNQLNKAFNLPNDHELEERLEEMIEAETGLDIDLSQ